jgi:chemosensory pili system protein ChpA (sensor histidine kinase/response regulator)
VFANIDRDVLIGFVEEVRANLSVIVGAVETLKKDGAAPGALQDAHRMFHTTKGASSMIGFAALSHIAYYAEEAIEDVMAGQLPLTPEVIETLLHTVGQIESYVGGLAAGTLAERPIVETTVAKFRRLRKLPETGDAAAVLELLTASADLSMLSRRFLPSDPVLRLAHHIDLNGAVSVQPADADDELLETFAEEAAGYVEALTELTDRAGAGEAEKFVFEEMRRTAHTLKGAAGMVGLQALNRLAHAMEDAAERLTSGKLTWTAGLRSLFQRTLEVVAGMIAETGDSTLIAPIERIQSQWKEIQAQARSSSAAIHSAAQTGGQAGGRAPGESPAEEDAPRPASFEAEATHFDATESGSTSVAEAPPAPPDDVDPELLETFTLEAEEHLDRMTLRLRALERDAGDAAALEDIRHSVHTLKGAAGMVGFATVSRLAHRMEDVLERAKSRNASVAAVLTVFFHSVALLRDLVHGGGVAHLASELAQLDALYAEIETHSAPAPETVAASFGASDSQTAADAAASELADVDPELVETFLTEADEHLQIIFRGLRRMEANPKDAAAAQDVRRSVHTLKGAAGMVGFRSVSQLAHRMEDAFDFLGDEGAAAGALDLFFATAHALEDMARGGGSRKTHPLPELYARYSALLGGAPPLPPPASEQPVEKPTFPTIELKPASGSGGSFDALATLSALRSKDGSTGGGSRRSGQMVRVPIERLDELVKLVSELTVGRATFEQYFRGLVQEFDELTLTLTRLRQVANKLEARLEVSALASGMAVPAVEAMSRLGRPARLEEFDALEFDRYTDLHMMSRELSETASDISSIGAQLGGTITDFDSFLSQLERQSGDVQDRVLRLRMLPVGTLTARLDRTVRVTAAARGKQVDFSIFGEDVELDKTVVEEVADPLLHILRNAVDHGIESPEVRRTFGKPERGHIRLLAYQEGTEIVVEVRDDGAGLNAARIRATAVERGLLAADEAESVGESDLFQFIFAPGFSTAQEVSEISGRGVGMDVVKSVISRLKGTVVVQSAPGRGTGFIIRLPMTLAVARALMVKAGGETFALPFAGVSQIRRVEAEEVRAIGSEPVLNVDGAVYPLVVLSKILGLKRRPQTDRLAERPPAVILTVEGKEYALVVDEVLEARDVVVKNLGTLLRRMRGVSGATLTGDGSVVLILNLAELLRESPRQSAGARTSMLPPAPAKEKLTVLIADDSVSVRRVISNLMKSAGYDPIVVKDGVEALEAIQNAPAPPDIILSDVEMPRMDGYELTSTLRSHPAYRDIPIVMITSRAGELHRRKAFSLGVSEYVVKPYQDETLLAVIHRLTQTERSQS